MNSLKSAQKKTYDLIIIDGRNLVYVYYYGMASLRNRKGVRTGLYHGFLSLICRQLLSNPEAGLVVAWEGGGLVRKAQLDTYKTTRPKSSDHMEEQCSTLKALLGWMGVSQLFAPGYEADDVAACLVARCSRSRRILLISRDEDWVQVMTPQTSVLRKSRELSYLAIVQEERFPPERYALYTVLRGKASNNVKGIPSFPDDLARALVRLCSDMQELAALLQRHVSSQKNAKWIAAIRDRWDELERLYNIVKVKTDVPLEEVACEPKNQKKLETALEELELKKVKTLVQQLHAAKRL